MGVPVIPPPLILEAPIIWFSIVSSVVGLPVLSPLHVAGVRTPPLVLSPGVPAALVRVPFPVPLLLSCKGVVARQVALLLAARVLPVAWGWTVLFRQRAHAVVHHVAFVHEQGAGLPQRVGARHRDAVHVLLLVAIDHTRWVAMPNHILLEHKKTLSTVYGFNLEYQKFCFTALLADICSTYNSHIQALKLYIYYYIGIHSKNVILALRWGAWKYRKLNACKKNTIYTVAHNMRHVHILQLSSPTKWIHNPFP